MKTLWQLWFLALLAAGLSACSDRKPPPVHYYVQLIWGTNRQKPEQAAFRAVGSRLKSELSRVFHWQRYWEVNRQEVDVFEGKGTFVRLSPECEVEIGFYSPGFRETRIYGRRVLVTRSRQRSDCHQMSIHGGSLEAGGSWFVVVREDAPNDN